MLEIRFQGRGGQGIMTAGDLLARAAFLSGLYAQAIPTFGPERRGGPSLCSLRIDTKPILLRCAIQTFDIFVCFDPTIWTYMNLFGGFKNKGIMIFNSKKHPKEIKKILQEKRYGYGVPQRSYQIFTVDAFSVARQILKRPIVNTAMLAATSKVTSLIPSEYIKQAINLRFPEDKEINNILFQKIQSMLLGPEGE